MSTAQRSQMNFTLQVPRIENLEKVEILMDRYAK